MNVLGTILLVVFIIVSLLLILLVLVQNEDSNGMGGVFGGGQSAAFGAHSASVLSKTTAVLVTIFFVVTFVLAIMNRPKAKDAGLTETAAEMQTSTSTGASTNWIDDVVNVEEPSVVEDLSAAAVDAE